MASIRLVDESEVRHDPKSVVRRGYNQISNAYRDDFGVENRGYPVWLERYLLPRLAPSANVLDLGCGNGVQQPGILRRIGEWLRPGGLFLATVGQDALTHIGDFYGATMYWSHADASTYCAWLAGAGIEVVDRQFIPEDPHGGHELIFGERRRGEPC